MTDEFRNWSGSVSFAPAEHLRLGSAEDVIAAVRRSLRSGSTLRAVGSGHSSTPLSVTDDVLLSVDDIAGLREADPDGGWAKLGAGTTIEEAGRALEEAGLAMANLGDVAYQTLAGAFATGTHGTGIGFTNLSSTLLGGQLVTGTGQVLSFGTETDAADDDVLRAARLSLGSLGILTEMTIDVIAAFELHRRNWITGIDWVLDHFHELSEQYRNVDFYWYPRSDEAQIRILDRPGSASPDLPASAWLKTEEVGPAWRIIPNDRQLKFEEMEYMLPLETGLDVMRRVRTRIKTEHRRHVGWRVLVRTIAADDTMLSNCYGRSTMSIALLHNSALPYEEYFGDIEPMLREAGGRPHWAKKHTMTAADLAPLYPEWDAFHDIRRRLDPEGIFMNDHLRKLFGEEDRP